MAVRRTVAVSRIPVIHSAWVRVCPERVMMMYALEQAATTSVARADKCLRIVTIVSSASRPDYGHGGEYGTDDDEGSAFPDRDFGAGWDVFV